MAQLMLGYITNWIRNETAIPFAVEMGGGWERWAQAQLCISMLRQNVRSVCEVSAYQTVQRPDGTNANYRADLVRSSANANHAFDWDVIELKCNDKDTLYTFFQRLDEDIQIVEEVPLKTTYTANGNVAFKWAVGVFRLADVRREYAQATTVPLAVAYLTQNYPEIFYHMNGNPNGALGSIRPNFEGCDNDCLLIWHRKQG